MKLRKRIENGRYHDVKGFNGKDAIPVDQMYKMIARLSGVKKKDVKKVFETYTDLVSDMLTSKDKPENLGVPLGRLGWFYTIFRESKANKTAKGFKYDDMYNRDYYEPKFLISVPFRQTVEDVTGQNLEAKKNYAKFVETRYNYDIRKGEEDGQKE